MQYPFARDARHYRWMLVNCIRMLTANTATLSGRSEGIVHSARMSAGAVECRGQECAQGWSFVPVFYSQKTLLARYTLVERHYDTWPTWIQSTFRSILFHSFHVFHRRHFAAATRNAIHIPLSRNRVRATMWSWQILWRSLILFKAPARGPQTCYMTASPPRGPRADAADHFASGRKRPHHYSFMRNADSTYLWLTVSGITREISSKKVGQVYKHIRKEDYIQTWQLHDNANKVRFK